MHAPERPHRDLCRQLVAGIPDYGIFAVEPDGRIGSWNPGAARIFGYEEARVLGQPLAMLYGAVAREESEAERLLWRAAAEGRAEHEGLGARADGSGFWLHLSLTAVPTAAGEGAGGFAVVARDVSEQHAAQEALRASEAKLSGIISLASDAIISIDQQQRIVLFNQGAEAIFGYPEAEILGQPLELLLPAAAHHDHARDVHRFGHSRIPARRMGERGEIRGRRRNGEIFPAEASISQIDVGGEKLYTAVLRDITERKRAEEELQLLQSMALAIGSAEDLQTALSNALQRLCEVTGWAIGEAWLPDAQGLGMRRGPVWATDAPRTAEFLDASGAMTFLYGYGLVGQVWASKRPRWVHDIASSPDFLRAAIARQIGLQTAVTVPVLANEDVVSVLAFYHFDARAEDVRLVNLVSAVASQLGTLIQRKRAEEALAQKAEELARSNAELERFAYVASHDLQEPLRMVASYTQLLAKRYRGQLDADAEEFIHYAVDGVTRMQALINDLLAYSRVGTRPRTFEQTDAGAVLERVLLNLGPAIEESGASVSYDPLPVVVADAVQLSQVFQNLIGNALKFSQPGAPARVHVSAERGEEEWVFSVRDNGIGIAPEYRERIFILFQRLHTRAEYPGTGIGLAICKKIIELHGGRIWLESELGQGSTFLFTIPDRE